jgi:hypothetical protein
MLRAETDLPDPAVRAAPGAVSWPTRRPAWSSARRITAIVAAVPAEAEVIADRLGRYADGGTVGGLPLSAFALATVRERVLVADNDARLFTGPLRSDLDPAGDGRLPAALHAAAATDIVEALPDGLEAEVAERGRSFSGGQQQRLRLVRALVADPETLILVEPTSAVDAHTEARIADRLVTARAGRTTVLCTSSPLVLDRTDRVLYVERAGVVAGAPTAACWRPSPVRRDRFSGRTTVSNASAGGRRRPGPAVRADSSGAPAALDRRVGLHVLARDRRLVGPRLLGDWSRRCSTAAVGACDRLGVTIAGSCRAGGPGPLRALASARLGERVLAGCARSSSTGPGPAAVHGGAGRHGDLLTRTTRDVDALSSASGSRCPRR